MFVIVALKLMDGGERGREDVDTKVSLLYIYGMHYTLLRIVSKYTPRHRCYATECPRCERTPDLEPCLQAR